MTFVTWRQPCWPRPPALPHLSVIGRDQTPERAVRPDLKGAPAGGSGRSSHWDGVVGGDGELEGKARQDFWAPRLGGLRLGPAGTPSPADDVTALSMVIDGSAKAAAALFRDWPDGGEWEKPEKRGFGKGQG